MVGAVNASRILFVEDDFDEQQSVLRVVNEFDPEIVLDIAHTGKEALIYLDNVPADELPRLVLLDLDLPIVHGLEVLKRIRRRRMTRSVPVTVFSSSVDVNDHLQCQALLASYVQKPSTHAEYEAALKGILTYWMRLNQFVVATSIGN